MSKTFFGKNRTASFSQNDFLEASKLRCYVKHMESGLITDKMKIFY